MRTADRVVRLDFVHEGNKWKIDRTRGSRWQALVATRAADAVSHGHQEDRLMQEALSDVTIKRAPAGAVRTSLYHPADGFTARA
jgi:hypothetical protein